MKKRIVSLILVVVMSLLALVSCSGNFNFIKEDLSKYATFDYADFKDKLAKLEIEDGDFTTNEETRKVKVADAIYTAVADAIIAAAYDSDKLEEGALGAGDVMYFVYYAVDEATGNIYFSSEMKESSITASSTKAKHVIKLGADFADKDADEFMKLIKENLVVEDIKDYVYSMLTASDIKAKAEEELKKTKPEATQAQIDAACAEALKVNLGDTVVISYTRSHTQTEGETQKVINETAAYETVTIIEDHPFLSKFVAEGSEAKVDSTLKVKSGDKTVTQFDVEIEGVKYTYKDVKVLWKVEKAGKEIATFKYTPYDDTNKVAPDNAYTGDKKELKDVELTYHVFPVYRLDVPAYNEIEAADVLEWVYAGGLVKGSFDLFKDDTYKNGDKTISELVAEVAKLYEVKSGGKTELKPAEDNTYYKDTELKTLVTAYNDAVKAGGSSPTTAQQKAIDAAGEALTKAQRAELVKIVEKIVNAKSGDKVAATELLAEYRKDTEHGLKEEYDTDITEKVQVAVWNLINDLVKVTSYPEKLVKEYYDHLYDSYEYEYYTGDYNSTTTNYQKYDSLESYIRATLELDKAANIEEAITKKAKSYIEPIIKIYVVSKACEADAVAAMAGENGYVDRDIKSGIYEIDEDAYRETYGDKADEKIAEAKKNAEESIDKAREEAGKFLIDDAYMKAYKKELGAAGYRSIIEQYGEINLRASFQFNRLFYYLTCTNIHSSDESGHKHTEADYIERDGVKYIDFRTVKYTLKADDAGDNE